MSIQDILDAQSTARALLPGTIAQIAALDKEIAHYARMNAEGAGVWGGYVLAANLPCWFVHYQYGHKPGHYVLPATNGMGSVKRFNSQKEAALVADKLNAALTPEEIEDGMRVFLTDRVSALNSMQAFLTKLRRQREDILRVDPQSDHHLD